MRNRSDVIKNNIREVALIFWAKELPHRRRELTYLSEIAFEDGMKNLAIVVAQLESEKKSQERADD